MQLSRAVTLYALMVLVPVMTPVYAQESDPLLEKGTLLLAEIDKNMSPGSFESYRKLINREPDGKEKEYVLWTGKSGTDKMVTTFLSPKSEIGRSTLRVGDNMWLYVPNVGKPIRITSLQSVVGGVFNNADIMQLEYGVEYTCTAYRENGASATLTLTAKSKSVAYDRLTMAVDLKTRYPTEIACYTVSGMLIKTLRFKEMKKFEDGIFRASVIETDSPLHKGYTSVMIYAKMKRRTFKDEVFTVNYMARIQDLRE